MNKFDKKIKSIQNGATYFSYNNKKYLATKSTLFNEKIIKFYAYELGGNDFVSLNYYSKLKLLKPCEMAEKKVIDFVLNAIII